MKNYVVFIDDHSGSMDGIASAAMADSNANRESIAAAAKDEGLDTVVSAFGIGLPHGNMVTWKYVISNPNVMKPDTKWPTAGGTPLYDGIWEAIEMHLGLPDYNDPNVSILMFITTDGEERHSARRDSNGLRKKIEELQATGRWTFVARMPEGCKQQAIKIGIPENNILEWDTSSDGMAKATVATQAATKAFYAGRTAGQKSSTVFYAQATNVDVSSLKDITKDVSLYVVPTHEMGIEIRDFILKHRMKYLKGSAFYQLTKTEPRVKHTKMIAVRDRTTGKIYAGKDARKMIGLPDDRNARLHPGDHGNYDIFIQSESVNRKLVGGTGVLYWEAIGKEFTEADLAYLKPKAPTAKPDVVQLPAVAPTHKPTASPIPVAKKSAGPTVNGKPVKVFDTRSEGRYYARFNKVRLFDAFETGVLIEGSSSRWFVYL